MDSPPCYPRGRLGSLVRVYQYLIRDKLSETAALRMCLPSCEREEAPSHAIPVMQNDGTADKYTLYGVRGQSFSQVCLAWLAVIHGNRLPCLRAARLIHVPNLTAGAPGDSHGRIETIAWRVYEAHSGFSRRTTTCPWWSLVHLHIGQLFSFFLSRFFPESFKRRFCTPYVAQRC